MRILYLTGDVAHGSDLQPHLPVHALARMAQREGHQVEVVTLSSDWFSEQRSGNDRFARDHRYLIKGVSFVRLAVLDAEAATAKFTKWLSEQQFDILHGVFAHPEDWPFELNVEMLPPLVISLTGHPRIKSNASNPTLRSWMRRADLHVAPSAYVASQWQIAWPGTSFRVLPHGVDLLGLIEAREAQMRDITAQSPPILLCVGTFDRDSGLSELLEVFVDLDRPDLSLCLIGSLDEQGTYGQSLIDRLKSDSRVQLIPASRPTSIREIAQPFDLICLLGEESGEFSMLVQECAAIGVPCFVGGRGKEWGTATPQRFLQLRAPEDASARAISLDQWIHVFHRPQQPSMSAAVPLRIEEEAFFYEGLYRGLAFNRLSQSPGG